MLRLYPPIPIFPRTAADYDILPSGHKVRLPPTAVFFFGILSSCICTRLIGCLFKQRCVCVCIRSHSGCAIDYLYCLGDAKYDQ